jgi:hypothetical protein
VRTLSCRADLNPAYGSDGARMTTAEAFNPHPNDNIKDLTISQGTHHSEEESVKYMIRKFPCLEEVRLDAWKFYGDLSYQTVAEFLRYISSIPKFALMGNLEKDEESLISDLVAVFIKNLFAML